MFVLMLIIILIIVYLIFNILLGSDHVSNDTSDGENRDKNIVSSKRKLEIEKAGFLGERKVYIDIKAAVKTGHIFCNLQVPTGYGNTTEIDVVLIHETGIYVFESKNYSGTVYGNEFQEQWVQIKHNNEKKYFYNPIKQNDTHICCLAHYLNLDEIYFYSYIVFGNQCSLDFINKETDDYLIINTHELFQWISEDIHYNDIQFTANDIEEIYQDLLKLKYSYCE